MFSWVGDIFSVGAWSGLKERTIQVEICKPRCDSGELGEEASGEGGRKRERAIVTACVVYRFSVGELNDMASDAAGLSRTVSPVELIVLVFEWVRSGVREPAGSGGLPILTLIFFFFFSLPLSLPVPCIVTQIELCAGLDCRGPGMR